MAFMLRLNGVPAQLFPYEMDDDIWFCRAVCMLVWLLYWLYEGLEKFTDALNDVPGLAFESIEWLHCIEKFFVWKKSGCPFSPVWSFWYAMLKVPLYLYLLL